MSHHASLPGYAIISKTSLDTATTEKLHDVGGKLYATNSFAFGQDDAHIADDMALLAFEHACARDVAAVAYVGQHVEAAHVAAKKFGYIIN